MKILLVLLLTYGLSIAHLKAEEVPSGGEMMIDALLVRPVSIVAIGIGLGLFIVSSPFALVSGEPSQSFKEISGRFVVYPFRFAFNRKVGMFPGYMEELELVSD